MKPKRERKKRGGFFAALFLLAAGFTGGMAAAGGLAVYFSELPLPLITPPTRDGGRDIARFREQERRETLEFHNLLRQDRDANPNIRGLESVPDEGGDEGGDGVGAGGAGGATAALTPAAERRFVYHLQVGVFDNPDAAEELRGTMALNGREAAVLPDNPAAPKSWRVRLGPYADERAAEEQRAILTLDGYNNVSLLKTVSKNRQ